MSVTRDRWLELAEAVKKPHVSRQRRAEMQVERMVRLVSDRLLETATELRAGTIHKAHAANRLEELAELMCKRSSKGEK